MSDPWGAYGSPWSVDTLPYGIFSTVDRQRRVGVAIGDHVLDLAALLDDDVFAKPTLNPFLARGPNAWRQTRERLGALLTGADGHDLVVRNLVNLVDVTLHLPVDVGDYVDFYSSIDHAQNLGRIFRPHGDALTPNWRHLPIGYHGRSGTIVVSGTPIPRPWGQIQVAPGEPPVYGPTQRLDIEAEIGFVVGQASTPGGPVATEEFADHVFGIVLVNDWSARDIQAWEATPLGPFLGKSFATSISPWVIPLDALTGARVRPPVQEPPVLPYLRDGEGWGFDLTLEVSVNDWVVSCPPFAPMYWTPAQQLAHLTANGASVRTGDLFASGTVSGPNPSEVGSLIELSENGERPFGLGDGSVRTFLEDGDTVSIRASAPSATNGRLGLGQVTGTVVPSMRRLPSA
jgi:fumarylacetoacetase